MTIYYRGPDPVRPVLVITESEIRARIPGGWRTWMLADLSGVGVTRGRQGAEPIMASVGTSVLLVGLLVRDLDGWTVTVTVAVLMLGCVMAVAEHRLRRSRTPSQLLARHQGVDVLLAELPRRDLEAACRGLVRALERRANA